MLTVGVLPGPSLARSSRRVTELLWFSEGPAPSTLRSGGALEVGLAAGAMGLREYWVGMRGDEAGPGRRRGEARERCLSCGEPLPGQSYLVPSLADAHVGDASPCCARLPHSPSQGGRCLVRYANGQVKQSVIPPWDLRVQQVRHGVRRTPAARPTCFPLTLPQQSSTSSQAGHLLLHHWRKLCILLWKTNDCTVLVPQAISDYGLPTATIPLEPRLNPGLPAASAELRAVGGGGALADGDSAAAAAEAGVGGLAWDPLTGNAVEPPSVSAEDGTSVCMCVVSFQRYGVVHSGPYLVGTCTWWTRRML